MIETLEAGDARASANESNEKRGKNARKAPPKLICQHALERWNYIMEIVLVTYPGGPEAVTFEKRRIEWEE